MSAKRNLPSWTEKGQSSGKKTLGGPQNPNPGFSTLLEGVVFVLSGFVNPERGVLRSQALEMGAEYQPDWNSSCTLLICAFHNTPKFRQVQAEGGTIVSKDWITECHTQRKLVDIEPYLMHAGKPWRRNNGDLETSRESNDSPSRRSQKLDERPSSKPTASDIPKGKSSSPAKTPLSPSTLKKWAIDDLNDTVSWLESQEEKPESSEIKKIAAEGILTFLQDTIDSLEQNQDVHEVTEQWNFIPRVVKELLKLEGTSKNSSSVSKKDLLKQAKDSKRVYETEFSRLGDDDSFEKKKPKTANPKDCSGVTANPGNVTGYDSDETIEMTEEEIDLAYDRISSKLHSQ